MKGTHFSSKNNEVYEINEVEGKVNHTNSLDTIVDGLEFSFIKLGLWVLIIPIIAIPCMTIFTPYSNFSQFILNLLTELF